MYTVYLRLYNFVVVVIVRGIDGWLKPVPSSRIRLRRWQRWTADGRWLASMWPPLPGLLRRLPETWTWRPLRLRLSTTETGATCRLRGFALSSWLRRPRPMTGRCRSAAEARRLPDIRRTTRSIRRRSDITPSMPCPTLITTATFCLLSDTSENDRRCSNSMNFPYVVHLGLPTVPEWPGSSRNWPTVSRVPGEAHFVLKMWKLTTGHRYMAVH